MSDFPQTINRKGFGYDVDSILSYKTKVQTASGTVSAKKGHPVVYINGKWYAYAATLNPLAQSITGEASAKFSPVALGVLAEDASLATSPAECRVIYSGRVWESFVRDAGVTSTVLPFDDLATSPGRIEFANEEE